MRPSIEFTIRYFAAFKTIYITITAIIAKNKIIVSTAMNGKRNLIFIKHFGSLIYCILILCAFHYEVQKYLVL